MAAMRVGWWLHQDNGVAPIAAGFGRSHRLCRRMLMPGTKATALSAFITAPQKWSLGRIRGWRIVVRYPHVQDGNSRQIFWRKLWTSFLLFSCSSCSSVGVAIGDIGGGDNKIIIHCRLGLGRTGQLRIRAGTWRLRVHSAPPTWSGSRAE